MTDFSKIPVEPADIEDAVRRIWQMDAFLEKFSGVLFDNDFFPAELKDELANIYQKEF